MHLKPILLVVNAEFVSAVKDTAMRVAAVYFYVPAQYLETVYHFNQALTALSSV